MREIKFRGKAIEDGKWRHGDLFKTTDGKCWIRVNDKDNDFGLNWVDYRVEPKTVGQFINQTDINNKDIYDGDYVSGKGLKVFEILWGECGWANKIHCDDGSIIQSMDSSKWILALIKVVGNIHENPELK